MNKWEQDRQYPNKTKFDKFMNRLAVPYGWRARRLRRRVGAAAWVGIAFVSLVIIAPPAEWTIWSVIISLYIGFLSIVVPLKIAGWIIWYGMEIINYFYEAYHYYYTGKRKEIPWLTDLYRRWRAGEFDDKSEEEGDKLINKMKAEYNKRVKKERFERKQRWRARRAVVKEMWQNWRQSNNSKK